MNWNDILLKFQKVFSIKTNILLKGMGCMIILIHHYSQYYIELWGFDNILSHCFYSFGGFYVVVLFFFLSGYGLEEYWKKHSMTLFSFLKKRIWKVYLPFFLVNCLTIIFYYYYRDIHLSFGQIISQIIGIELNDKVLWYMQALLILYVIFIVSKQWNFYPPIL